MRYVATTWILTSECGTRTVSRVKGFYPGVSVFGCACGSQLSCNVAYRALVYSVRTNG